jgi:D-alanine transaminase
MLRVAYVNGRYQSYRDAMVHIEDRGYQFSDGVYEVCEVRDGLLIDERRHVERMHRSLDALKIAAPMSDAALGVVLRETVARNRVRNGIVYIQITRGVARRDHAFPPIHTPVAMIVTARRLDRGKYEREAALGVTVVTVPDNRWGRVDIKSISLLPNVLAKQAAREQGAREAWYVDEDGLVTEGSSSNAWIVTEEGALLTRPTDHGILRGVARTVVIEVARAHGLRVEERAFSVEEAYAAREAFMTAASQIVLPVVRIDEHPIGSGTPGPIAIALRRDFHRYAEVS